MTAPVCADLQDIATRCLLTHQRRSLDCASEVNAFNQCVRSQRQVTLLTASDADSMLTYAQACFNVLCD